jgi:hypothetical protein
MGRFNTVVDNSKPDTVNKAGGEAYSLSPKAELVALVLTSFLKGNYYESDKQQLNRLKKLCSEVEPLFLAKLAIFARNKYGMRAVSHVIAGEIAKSVKNKQWTKSFFNKVIFRVDDMLEILGYYQSLTGKKKLRPIPNAMKKGFREAFKRFDAYQLAKYKNENKAIKLIDVVNLVKPVPSEKNREALHALVKGELKNTNTWEAKISKAGQEAKKQATTEEEKKEIAEKLKADSWKELIETRKIGYFALLRNLRNIVQQAPEMVDRACNLLVDKKLIKNSKVFPFRFLTAIQEIEKLAGSGYEHSLLRKIMIAINEAIDISLDNVPEFEGKTLIAVDCSGSMGWEMCGNLTANKIASVFAAVMYKRNSNADVMQFGYDAQYKMLNPLDSTMTLSQMLTADEGSTNFRAIFQRADKAYDRVIILSDMQGWVGYHSPYTTTFKEYRKKYNCDPYIYSFDLTGNGSSQFPQYKISLISGFSDKVFDTMKNLEQNPNALIDEIEAVII